MKKLIVNADDFGLTPGVCEGILRAHQDGIVTSTTILINAPDINSSLEKLISFPGLDLGLHLNITWGTPVLPVSQVKTLVGEDGLFIRRKSFDEVNPEEAREEWGAQIEKAKSLGLSLSHLDTHHHSHLHPALLDVLFELARVQHLAVRSPASWARDFLRANLVPTPDHFIIDFYGEGKTTMEHLTDLLRYIPDGFTELMCHPAIVDDELRKTSSYTEQRERELETLTSPRLKEWLAENEIVLADFRDLPAPGDEKHPDKSCDLISPNEIHS